MLPQMRVTSAADFDAEKLFGGAKKEICLEIGFGDGQHLYGKAMDICVQGVPSSTLLAYIKQQPEIAYTYAIDGNYCHMDIK